MKHFTKYLGGILVILLLITPQNVLAYKKIKCFVLKPPEKILPGVERIAILDFECSGSRELLEGEVKDAEDIAIQILDKLTETKTESTDPNSIHGQNFSNYLITNLLKEDRGIHEVSTGFLGLGSGREGSTLQEGTFTNIYDIVERTQITQIIEEQKLGAAGFIDQNQAVELGNLLGVQAIIIGNISYTHKDSKYQETRTRKVNKQTTRYKVKCKKREVNVTVRAKIVSAETAQILASTENSKNKKEATCEDRTNTLSPIDELINSCLEEASAEIAKYIAPTYEFAEYELEKIKSGKYKTQAEKAAELAEELKIDEAYFIYKSAYDKNPYNPELLYNLCLMHEVVGNFEKAKEFAGMAYQLKDKGRFKDAVKRLEQMSEFSDALAQIGIEIKKHSFEISEAEKAQIVAKKVKTKGSRDDRVAVHALPDQQSEITVYIPGDLTFTVVKKEGEWYLIQLLGGNEGYVHSENVELQ